MDNYQLQSVKANSQELWPGDFGVIYNIFYLKISSKVLYRLTVRVSRVNGVFEVQALSRKESSLNIYDY